MLLLLFLLERGDSIPNLQQASSWGWVFMATILLLLPSKSSSFAWCGALEEGGGEMNERECGVCVCVFEREGVRVKRSALTSPSRGEVNRCYDMWV